jgi:hypothetical protein
MITEEVKRSIAEKTHLRSRGRVTDIEHAASVNHLEPDLGLGDLTQPPCPFNSHLQTEPNKDDDVDHRHNPINVRIASRAMDGS